MSFPCPYLGTEQATPHCKRPSLNIRGLKTHLTRQHGGWTTDQIQAALEANPPMPEATEADVELFPDGNAPSTETATAMPPERERTRSEPIDAERSSKGRKAAIRLSKSMSGLKDFVAKLIPHLTVGFLNSKGIDGKLTQEGADTLSESWAAFFDFLGIDIENIEPVKMKINGRKALFLFPLSMFGMTLLFMKGANPSELFRDLGGKKKPEPTKPPQPPPVVPIFTPENAAPSDAEAVDASE